MLTGELILTISKFGRRQESQQGATSATFYHLPVKRLKASYAIPVVKQSYDKTQLLYFGLVPF
jgi:hypothetical protein